MTQITFQDKAKEAAGKAAVDYLQNGMTLGIGTGTTVAFFLEHLIIRCKEGLRISAIATSEQTRKLALRGNIPLLDSGEVTHLDLAVDGADEIDQKKQMIKGGGGALLREKITAFMADQMIVIIDEKKHVEHLGAFPLPVEIAPFGIAATLLHLTEEGFHPRLRHTPLNNPFMTDNGNFIADLFFQNLITDPANIDHQLRGIPGILETGLFLNLAKTVIIGHANGTITTLK